MKIEVWVVRDSACGNGDDDPGEVLGVFVSQESADQFANEAENKAKSSATYRGRSPSYCVNVEGPFDLEIEPIM